MDVETERLRSDVLYYRPNIDGREHTVPVPILHSADALTEGLHQTHLYLGLGEEESAAPLGLDVLHQGGIHGVNVTLDFTALPCTDANLERMVIEVPHMVTDELNARAGNPTDHAVHLVSSSQGGGAAIMTASRAPEKFGAIAALGPVGLTPEVFQDGLLGGKARFLWRLAIVNGLMRPENTVLKDRGNWEAVRAVGGRALKDLFAGRLGPKLDFALSRSLAADVAKLSADHDVAIFVPTHDPVFRLHEIQAALDKVGAGHVLHEVPGPHATVFNRAGRTALAHAVTWLRNTQQAQAAAQGADTV